MKNTINPEKTTRQRVKTVGSVRTLEEEEGGGGYEEEEKEGVTRWWGRHR